MFCGYAHGELIDEPYEDTETDWFGSSSLGECNASVLVVILGTSWNETLNRRYLESLNA